MKALPKDITTARDKLIADLAEAEDRISRAVTKFNAAMEAPRRRLEEAIEAYNALVADVTDLVADAEGQVQSYYDDMSEKWQESERGALYQQWINDLGFFTVSEIEVELPDPVEDPACDAQAVLEQEFPTELPGG